MQRYKFKESIISNFLNQTTLMKRFTTLFIFLVYSIFAGAQWNKDPNIDKKCSHSKVPTDKMYFDPDYYWQSKYLFDYDVTSYLLDIEVSDTTTYVEGNVIINCVALVALDTFAFELIEEQQIDKIIFNGTEYANYSRNNGNVLVPVAEVPEGTLISAQIYYHGKPPTGGFFSGVTTDYSPGWQKHVTWTLSEPFAAKSWFPVKQVLEDKADSAWVFLTTASTNKVGSQGLLTNVVDLGNNKLRHEWKTSYPIDYYLISFAVADYLDYSIYAHPEEMGSDSLLIQNYIYNAPGNLAGKKDNLDNTIEIIELYSDLFTLYPFHKEKYGHCETQLGGGMEHQTMSTMGNFSFHLVAHELGHMWFGDNVTCATWSDIWINEGFATYADCLAHEFILGREAGKTFIKNAQDNAMSVPNGSIYIPEDEIYPGNEWRIFSGRLSYDKGATIIHMLRHEIQNDELFFDVLKSFQMNFGGSTATGENFKETAEEITGMIFDQFFSQWYYGQGFPIYNLKYWTDEQNTFYLSSMQTTSSLHTTLFDMLLDFRLRFADGSDTLVRFRQTENLNVFSMGFDQKVTHVEVDPDQWTMEEVVSISSIGKIEMSPLYFIIGPNPVREKLNVYFLNKDSESRKIRISNLAGQQIFSGETTDDLFEFSTSNLRSGVYFVSVSSGNNTITKKFIK